MTSRFAKRSAMPVPAAELFAWHARPGAFERLVPPWERIELREQTDGIRDGSRVVLGMRAGPLPLRWVAHHEGYREGERFVDRQVRGPFARWVHEHLCEADGATSFLHDRIEYALPLEPLSRWLAGRGVARQLARTFAWRHATTAADLAAHRGAAPMRIAVTGATGLIGSALRPFLTTGGHTVLPVGRTRAPEGGLAWDPDTGQLDGDGLDALVHLAAEPVAAGRWTAERRARIRASRVDAVRRLAGHLAGRDRPPPVVIATAGTGRYGDRGDEVLDEDAAAGDGFLAGVSREAEEAWRPLEEAGTRVVHLRLGIVLDPRGGALARMLRPFRLGLGGRIGSGRQWWSWIALDDALGVILHALRTPALHGPVNAVSPHPATQEEFTRTLARVLRRPALFPIPAPVARLFRGDMADELMLASARVAPARLLDTGYAFRTASLDDALRRQLGRTGA